MPKQIRVHTVVESASWPTQPFHAYKLRLPHWRQTGATYFVTWRVHPLQSDLNPNERDIVVDVLGHFHSQRHWLYAYVVMNDHVHALVEPVAPYQLQQLIHSWKTYSVYRMRKETARRGPVWQREYFDRIVRGELEFQEKLAYIYGNPEKRWPGTTAYRWLGGVGQEADPTTVSGIE